MATARAKKPTTLPVIEVLGVTKRFKDLVAVDHLDLKIGRGEFTALLGPNGAGKTTLVEMIEGILPPDSGTIRILGRTWHQHRRELRFRIGVALQETRFYDKLTTAETLDLFACFYDRPKTRVKEVLRFTRLEEKRDARVVTLSGGQRQRLALGIALINEPEVLLLDEPTTGLDPNARREVWQILQDLKTRGVSLILTTHYMEEAEKLCDRILIMDRGRFLAGGSLPELLRLHGGGEIIEFAYSGNSNKFAKVPGLLRSEGLTRGRMRLVVQDIHRALPAVWKIIGTGRSGPSDLVCRRMNLDDLFTIMTGRHLDETAS